jgi:hypothetical protein
MIMRACNKVLTAFAFAGIFIGAQAQAQTAPPAAPTAAAPVVIPDVDLKLFETTEVDRSKGCTVALWQANRDPDKDKFAYIFIEQLTGRSNARQPARIKIGGQSVNITRVAMGGKNNGYNLFEYQLYKLPAEDEFVVLELKLGELMGEAVEVEGGTMSVIQKGRQVFRASVKGGAGCMTAPVTAAPASAPAPRQAAAPAPARAPVPAVNEAGPAMFQRYDVRANEVPRAMVQAAVKQFGCEAVTMRRPVIGYQLSEESALWQLACGEYAENNFSAVFALVYIPNPAQQYEFVKLDLPKGVERGLGDYPLMGPRWDMKTRIVTGIFMEGPDCGQYERYRVTPEGGLKLVEFRSRTVCDGKRQKPEDMQLIFPKR